jgi:hypothetical protein
MVQTLTAITPKHPEWSPVPETEFWQDSSPFGLQGLARESLQILKPDCVTRLAVTLALRATRKQIRDPEYVNRVLSWHPDWIDEYQVVHLIEKSLWIQGHSDLVMTMTRNPSQIPDNPPPKIMDALSRAYLLHPEAAIWYGVPLFSDQRNDDDLPIPVTAAEVRSEAARRIQAAQQHALRWRWAYRAALKTAQIPAFCWHCGISVRNRIRNTIQGVSEYFHKCRQDARKRARAIALAENQRCRFGESDIEIPAHRTGLGRSLETAFVIMELMAYQASLAGSASPFIAAITGPLVIAKFSPMIFFPLTVVACDPFLFVELPEEPGKLRHLGHWYWQPQSEGGHKLHLHV